MTVYIEYAFLQNFLLDGVLLWLSLQATKTPIKWAWLFFAALVGGIFAVLYPLLKLPNGLGTILKLSVGCLLCMLAFGKIKGKRAWKNYALFTALFFAFSFAFGGALLGMAQGKTLKNMQNVFTPLGFALLTAIALFLIQKMYKKRALQRHIYDCKIISGEKSVMAQGFLDSGNAATKNGLPVCFLSPETVFELWGNEIIFGEKGRGQVCDEMQIVTMSGTRRVPLYKGGLEIKTERGTREIKEVYFALSANIISREYQILLHSRIFDQGEEL